MLKSQLYILFFFFFQRTALLSFMYALLLLHLYTKQQIIFLMFCLYLLQVSKLTPGTEG